MRSHFVIKPCILKGDLGGSFYAKILLNKVFLTYRYNCILILISAFYKFVWKSVKIVDRIFLAMQYWLKSLYSPICSTNTKLSFGKSESGFATLQRFFLHVGVSYKFLLKSVKNLERIFERFNIGSRLYNDKFGQQIQNHFLGKRGKTWNYPKKIFLYWSCL